METFCATGTPPKFRSTLANNFYHNVPRNVRQVAGNDYGMSACATTRRSTPSVHALWQEPMSARSCVERKPRGRMCSVVLAIASFLVLIAVLSIAGLALYMGTLHSEPTANTNVLSFSVSAKVLRGDRFIGALQEKARRYRLQLETLYQKSVLGPSLISCTVEKFGNDTLTVFFKLTFNKKKLNRNISNLERTIRDILITDAIARKPVFRTIRFDPKNIDVRQINAVSDLYQRNVKPKVAKSGIVAKTAISQNSTFMASSPVKKKPVEEADVKDEDLPVIHGSFKISKTDADITEKKTDNINTTPKTKHIDKSTTISPINNKKSTSALYKIAAIEKISKSSITTTTTVTTPIITSTTSKTTTSSSSAEVSSLFINPETFDQEPWIPILPESEDVLPSTTVSPKPTTTELIKNNRHKPPVYTSFTNPGLSVHSLDLERLGSTSLKSHPIPVNKISEITEPSIFKIDEASTKENIITTTNSENQAEQTGFVEVETVKYIPGANTNSNSDKSKQDEQILKNLSSIFHNLASTLNGPNLNFSQLNMYNKSEETEKTPVTERENGNDMILGQGQVEVVEADEEALMMQTTKLPLVTLIPVKSNSGIGRPLRKRPFNISDENASESSNLSVENRSFPGSPYINNLQLDKTPLKLIETEVVTSISTEVHKKKWVDDFKIVGVLNFATESTDELNRNPKMEGQANATKNNNKDEITVYSTNSSVSSNHRDPVQKKYNVLTPEQLKQLSEISKIHDNSTDVISNKAISSSYTINHAGLKILTKNFNKINELTKDSLVNNYNNNLSLTTFSNNKTECGNHTIKCGDGQCLPETTKCNQLIDCKDGLDEQDCNCADYLRSQYLLRKICDGVVDCWDYSDENQCDWCTPNQYVCGNSKECIDRNKICDGIRDCPQGDDERQCVTIATDTKAADEFPYYSEGYLMVRKFGTWGKLCVENFRNVVSRSHISWEISDLGKAVCRSMTYQSLDSIRSVVETDRSDDGESKYFELSYQFQNKTKSSLSFLQTKCKTRKVVKVKCQSLECGARPQVVRHLARIVGGGNAGLGSWPWQAALYKEGEFQCGATLLSDRWLVSAGHCFYHSQDEHWVARLGALRRGTALPSPYEQLRSVVKIIVHPGYVDSGFINDISLLKMEFSVIFSDYVRPICLPLPDQPTIDGKLCTVVGWGQLFEVGRIFPDTLQEVQVPIISTAECRKRTVFLPLYKITDDMFCAGYERGGRDACLGDSGGPLMCPETNGRWILQGITSNGYGCARANRPGVYTKVSNYVSWIDAHMDQEDDYSSNTNSNKSVCLGHRCPLGECLPKSRLCNSYIECSDGSDERDC